MRSRGGTSNRAWPKYLRVQLLARVFLPQLARERIILSDQGTASMPHKWPPRPIRELPLPQLPLEVGRDSTGLYVALRPFARYKERFEAIGWTKTQVIARGLNRQNHKERLDWAETKGNSTRKLQSLMKGETPPSDARRVVLYFTKKQYKAFEKAVVQHGGSIAPRKNLVDKEAAVLELIKKAALS
jgi:hypothetical protein